MRYLCLLLCISAACDVDRTSDDVQDVVSGVFTITQPAQAFVLDGANVLDTGTEPIVDGSVWLSASISVHCQTATFVRACGREYDPAAPGISTRWCAEQPACVGDVTLTIPMSAFSADTKHALALSLERGTVSVSVSSAVLTVLGFGP